MAPADLTHRAALLELAGTLGIETHYTDALGENRQISDETLLAVIAAFGLPANPIEAGLELKHDRQALSLGLAAVQIVQAENSNPRLVLRLPAGCGQLAWTCWLEAGEVRSGSITVDVSANERQFAMPLPGGLPLGYHRLEVEASGTRAETDLIVAPARCYLPAQLGPGSRSWGLSCQLYGLRSDRNWGIGDFSDLAGLGRTAGRYAASVLGINPLHALFTAEPRHISPYSPSSRSHLNDLYIDPATVPEFADCAPAQAMLANRETRRLLEAARASVLVDHAAVSALKRPLFELLY